MTRSSPAHRLGGAVALLLAARFLAACAAREPRPSRAFVPLAASPSGAAAVPTPDVELAQVRASEGTWSRQRLSYTQLVYEMPGAAWVLRVDEDGEGDRAETEIAYTRTERAQVTYEARATSHRVDDEAARERAAVDSLRAAVQRNDGRITRELRLRQSGYPGIQVSFDLPGARRAGQSRLLFDHSYAYTATVTYPAGASSVLQPDIEHFFAALELDAADLHRTAGDGRPGEPAWFRLHDAPFVARFPGAPRREAHTLTFGSTSRPRVTYTVGTDASAERWQVAVTTFPARPPAEALTAALAAWTSAGWTVRDEAPATDQGFVGRVYALERDAGARRATLRLCVTPRALFEVLAVYAAGADEAPVRAFFQSFRAFVET